MTSKTTTIYQELVCNSILLICSTKRVRMWLVPLIHFWVVPGNRFGPECMNPGYFPPGLVLWRSSTVTSFEFSCKG